MHTTIIYVRDGTSISDLLSFRAVSLLPPNFQPTFTHTHTFFLLTVFLHFLNFRLRSLGKRAVHPNNPTHKNQEKKKEKDGQRKAKERKEKQKIKRKDQ